jgi:beta-ureidopropionase
MGIKIAGVQMRGAPVSDKTVNVEKAIEFVREASRNGAQIVVLQELFSTGYFPTRIDRNFFDMAEDDEGPTVSMMKETAKKLGIYIVAPFFEMEKNCIGRYYDSAVVLSPAGENIGKYRKLHLPSISWTHEKFYFTPGNLGSPVFECGEVRMGIEICYDRHYPELTRIMVLKGANLVVIPTMTTKKAGRVNVWIPELISLAANNHVFVLGVNSTGTQEDKEHFGHSAFVDPFGQVTSELQEEEGIAYGNLDLDLLKEARNTYNHLRDIRPDVTEKLLQMLQPQK